MIWMILKNEKIETKQLKNVSITKRVLTLIKKHERNVKEKKEVNIVRGRPINRDANPC